MLQAVLDVMCDVIGDGNRNNPESGFMLIRQPRDSFSQTSAAWRKPSWFSVYMGHFSSSEMQEDDQYAPLFSAEQV